MPEEKKDYTKISRSKLEEIAKEVEAIEDHAKRFEEVTAAIVGYHKSGVLDAEHRKPAMEMQNPEGGYKKMWDKLYSPLDKEHAKRGADLEGSVATEWMKKFADVIMPAMKAGTEGEKIHNYTNLIMYMNRFDQVSHQEQGTTRKKVTDLIKKGHGAEAAAMIIEAIRESKKNNEFSHFLEILLPDTDKSYEFRKHAAKTIADAGNDYLKKQGLGEKKQISVGKIADDLPTYFQHYSNGNMPFIIESAAVKKEKEKK